MEKTQNRESGHVPEEKAPVKPFSEQAMSLVEGALYEHYKGKRYKFLFVARHSETLEELVVYQALYGEYGIWVRPLTMFLETIEVHGIMIPRFKRLSANV